MNTFKHKGKVEFVATPTVLKQMTALEFELAALECGLKIGFKKDFQWVESEHKGHCCLLCSGKAVLFADKLGIEKEITQSGLYVLYFSA